MPIKLHKIKAFCDFSASGISVAICICEELPTAEVMQDHARASGALLTCFSMRTLHPDWYEPEFEEAHGIPQFIWDTRYYSAQGEVRYSNPAKMALACWLEKSGRNGSDFIRDKESAGYVNVDATKSGKNFRVELGVSYTCEIHKPKTDIILNTLKEFSLSDVDLSSEITPYITDNEDLVFVLKTTKTLFDLNPKLETIMLPNDYRSISFLAEGQGEDSNTYMRSFEFEGGSLVESINHLIFPILRLPSHAWDCSQKYVYGNNLIYLGAEKSTVVEFKRSGHMGGNVALSGLFMPYD